MAWSSETLSTLTTISKWEREIIELTSYADNEYMATAVNIADDTDPIATLVDSISVSGGKGTLEILGIVNTAVTIADGYSLTIKMYDSADNSTFAEIHNGQRVYYKAASGSDVEIAAGTELFRWVVPSDCEDYIKPVITSDANNSGKLDIYSISKWSDKIDKAKDIIGVDIELELQNRGYQQFVDYDIGEVLLDMVKNPAEFIIASDFKALELIYLDLSGGNEESNYYQKAAMYQQRYDNAFRKALKLVDLDTDFDADTDEHQANVHHVGRTTR